VTPVIARCPCGWPIAECLEHAPPSVDPYGLAIYEAPPPPVAITIAIGGVTVAAVVVIGSVATAAWAVSAILDALGGRP
jgi:hypothetical protein